MRFVGDCLRPHRVAVEFRHRSWNAANLADWLAHIDMDVVSVGVPDIPSLFPAGLRVANRRVYARLHTENAANWYAGDKARYDFDYPDARIRAWAADLRAAAAEGRADGGAVFFNNCAGTHAVTNAKRLTELMDGVAGVNRIKPPAQQAGRGLFDGLE